MRLLWRPGQSLHLLGAQLRDLIGPQCGNGAVRQRGNGLAVEFNDLEICALGRKPADEVEDEVLGIDVRAEFPVDVQGGGPTALEMRVLGRPPAALNIVSCSASLMQSPDQEVFRPAIPR